jgi:hypothetical protein
LSGSPAGSTKRKEDIGIRFFACTFQVAGKSAQEPVSMSRIEPLTSGIDGPIFIDGDILPAMGVQGIIVAQDET